MARPREFDEAEALDRAMEVFWRQGYQRTSTDDLMDAMGIGRGSFYNAFGSKRDTYLRTLDRYLARLGEVGPYTALFEEEPGAEAFHSVLTQYLETCTQGSPEPHGCYFVHAAKEHLGEDPEVVAAVQAGIAKMRRLLGEHVAALQAQGHMPAGADPDRLALLLMSVVWGSHVMMEAGMPMGEVLSSTSLLFEICQQCE